MKIYYLAPVLALLLMSTLDSVNSAPVAKDVIKPAPKIAPKAPAPIAPATQPKPAGQLKRYNPHSGLECGATDANCVPMTKEQAAEINKRRTGGR
jgi:hypothetical protein